jgi:hypothetical protein
MKRALEYDEGSDADISDFTAESVDSTSSTSYSSSSKKHIKFVEKKYVSDYPIILKSCISCQRFQDSNILSECNVCYYDYCVTCSSICETCQKATCINCSVYCGLCMSRFCEDCMEKNNYIHCSAENKVTHIVKNNFNDLIDQLHALSM